MTFDQDLGHEAGIEDQGMVHHIKPTITGIITIMTKVKEVLEKERKFKGLV